VRGGDRGEELTTVDASDAVYRNALTAFLGVYRNVLTAFLGVYRNVLTAFLGVAHRVTSRFFIKSAARCTACLTRW